MTQELSPAAGYIRVSRKIQAEGYSPELQAEGIKNLAAQEGYYLPVLEEDHESGSRVSRKGYQRVLEAARAGEVHAILVYMLDRWGRDGAEWLARARELDRLRVPILSVQEGRDEGGLMRFVRAGMAEEYNRQLAKRVRPAKERAAREGKHLGVTPIGFKRVYPAHEGSGRYVAGLLVEDAPTSWVVKELFERYAAGGWSLRRLAAWLNSDPDRFPRAPKGGDWTTTNVGYMLKNPVYYGGVRYNASHHGIYETSAPGSEFVAEGQHCGFIEPELFEAVQKRLAANRKRPTYNRLARNVPLGAGILVCAECGGSMAPSRSKNETWSGQYICLNRNSGRSTCKSSSYTIPLAHAAILAEVKRLQGLPWKPQALEHAAEDRESEKLRAKLIRDLERERKRREQNLRLLMRIGDPTDEEIAEFRRTGAEIAANIKAIEARLATIPTPDTSLPDLEALHCNLIRVQLSGVVDSLQADNDADGLRELVKVLVESAKIVDRLPTNKSKWARAEVKWKRDVQMLLDYGLLTLAPPADRPKELTRQEYDALKYQRRKQQLGPYWRKDKAVPQAV